MIEAEGLTKFYGTLAAIRDVSFKVEPGEIIGFLGPNAAGKTTTMRILTGFSPPSRGTARIAGFDIASQPIDVKRRVGYLPESVPLYVEMPVSRFLAYVAEVKGVPKADRRRELDRVMDRCGLAHMASRLIRNLSKGYRQRVGLAQALIGNPPVLILDEPTVGLDPSQIVEIRRTIKDLAPEHTVLLSTHILPEVQMVCERVIIINRGRIVAQDSMAALSGGARVALDLHVAQGADAVRRELERIEDIESFTSPGPGHFEILCKAGADPRAAVSDAAARVGASLLELRRRARTLEEIFISVVTADAVSGDEGGDQ